MRPRPAGDAAMAPLVTIVEWWRRHPRLVQGYTSRRLGNLSYRTAPAAEAAERRVRLAAELGIDPGRMFSIPLGHTNRVVVLRDDSFLARRDRRGYVEPEADEILAWPVLTPEAYAAMPHDREYADGVVFAAANVYALVITADCAAVGFYDPVRQAAGNAHVGLLGAVNELPKGMVAALVESFGSRPADIEAVIFPCIRPCHYATANSQTWLRIRERVHAAFGEDNPLFASGYFDLPGMVRSQLRASGLLEEHIFDVGLCTVCNADTLFSHVAAGSAEAQAREGRFGAVMGFRPEAPGGPTGGGR